MKGIKFWSILFVDWISGGSSSASIWYMTIIKLERLEKKNFQKKLTLCSLSKPSFFPVVGRDDFNFLSWIVSASSYIVSVTERNSLDSMVLVWVVLHTQHKRYPCDRNFSKEWKNMFLVSCSVNLNRCLPYSLNPPQLPRETLWMGCVRSGIWPTPPTSAHIVTEKDSHWEKTIHMVRRGS